MSGMHPRARREREKEEADAAEAVAATEKKPATPKANQLEERKSWLRGSAGWQGIKARAATRSAHRICGSGLNFRVCFIGWNVFRLLTSN